MRSSRSEPPEGELLRCADVLGAFGVRPADLRALEGGSTSPVASAADTGSLETVLAERLADARDRTAFVRQTICRSDRGMACGARYADDELAAELASAFDAIGWTFELHGTPGGLELVATDPKGRRRETTMTYPETPLGDDNLPAVLYAINDALLDGTDGRLVLLSSGVDRWRAALVDVDELDRLTEQYGPRIDTFDRPLLPAHEPAAYVPEASTRSAATGLDDTTASGATSDEPWPEWALDRADRRSNRSNDVFSGSIGTETRRGRRRDGDIFRTEDESADSARDDDSGIFSGADRSGIFGGRETETTDSAGASGTTGTTETSTLVDERGSDRDAGIDSFIEEAESDTEPAAGRAPDARRTTESSTGTTIDGFTLTGSATVSRVSETDGTDRSDAGEGATQSGSSEKAGRSASSEAGGDTGGFSGGLGGSTDDSDDDDDDGWTLSGTTKTTRVSNDSFGTDDTLESEDEQYQALGAALTTGQNVSVTGLLDDDEFLPELPAVEPEETRLTFEDSFDPDAVGEAKAAAEESGFVWVDSGSIETKRVSNS